MEEKLVNVKSIFHAVSRTVDIDFLSFGRKDFIIDTAAEFIANSDWMDFVEQARINADMPWVGRLTDKFLDCIDADQKFELAVIIYYYYQTLLGATVIVDRENPMLYLVEKSTDGRTEKYQIIDDPDIVILCKLDTFAINYWASCWKLLAPWEALN